MEIAVQSPADPIELAVVERNHPVCGKSFFIDNKAAKELRPTQPVSTNRWVKSVNRRSEQMKQNCWLWVRVKCGKDVALETTSNGDLATGQAATSGDPMGLTTSWLKLMEDVQTPVSSAGEVLPVRTQMTLFRQWYEATERTMVKIR